LNYNDLTALVVDNIEDGDVDTAQAQIFIAQAEDTLQRDLLDRNRGGSAIPRQMLARLSDTTATDGTLTLPADYFQARSVAVDGTPSRYAAPERVAAGQSGFGEAPVVLDYYQQLPPLSASNPTNWLSDVAYTLYLWGACLQFVPWGDALSKRDYWGPLYESALSGVKKSNGPRARGGWMPLKGRPYGSFYTVIGDQMIFGAQPQRVLY
jgi:hypothetical protein